MKKIVFFIWIGFIYLLHNGLDAKQVSRDVHEDGFTNAERENCKSEADNLVEGMELFLRNIGIAEDNQMTIPRNVVRQWSQAKESASEVRKNPNRVNCRKLLEFTGNLYERINHPKFKSEMLRFLQGPDPILRWLAISVIDMFESMGRLNLSEEDRISLWQTVNTNIVYEHLAVQQVARYACEERCQD